jgi:hypothetical protein
MPLTLFWGGGDFLYLPHTRAVRNLRTCSASLLPLLDAALDGIHLFECALEIVPFRTRYSTARLRSPPWISLSTCR